MTTGSVRLLFWSECVMNATARHNRARGPLAMMSLCALLALAIAGCDAGATSVSHPTATTTPAPTATPKILYQADWAGGASQWSLAQGWQLTPTGLSNSGNGSATATSVYIPYTPTASSYTIEMVIQLNNVLGAVACGNELGLEAQTPAGEPIYYATVTCVERNFHTFAEIYSATDTSQFHTNDYTPGRTPRVYDVIVDGSYATYVINGAEVGTVKCDRPTAPIRLLLLNVGLQTEIQRITITTP